MASEVGIDATCNSGITVFRYEMPVRGGHDRPWRVECWVADDRLTILPITIHTPDISWGLPMIMPDHLPSRGSGWIAGEAVPMTRQRAIDLQSVYLERYDRSTPVLMQWQDTVGVLITKAFLGSRANGRAGSGWTADPAAPRLR